MTKAFVSVHAASIVDAPEVIEVCLVAILGGVTIMASCLCEHSGFVVDSARRSYAHSNCHEAGYSEGLVHHVVNDPLRWLVKVLLKIEEIWSPFIAGNHPAKKLSEIKLAAGSHNFS